MHKEKILAKIKKLPSLLFQKFGRLNPWQKRSLALGAIVLLLAGSYFWNVLNVRSAAYSWIQATWTGGADTVNFPNHTSNQTGWTKYYSKDTNVKTSDANKVTLNAATDTSLQTSDTGTGDRPNVGGFNAGTTKTNVYVYNTGTAASVKLLKPDGATCSSDSECAHYCFSDTGKCDAYGNWIASSCGTHVYNADISSPTATYQWKTAQTSCVGPQCATNLDPSYMANYSLVADNVNVDFSTLGYTARQACKLIGGRLPRMSELSCIYTAWNNSGRGTIFGGTFQSLYYWSATEYSAGGAYFVYFFYGGTSYFSKGSSYYVRCVR